MKMYECIIDDGMDVYKSVLIGINKKTILEQYSGNGAFIKMTDITKTYFGEFNISDIDTTIYNLRNALLEHERFERHTIDLICELLECHMVKQL